MRIRIGSFLVLLMLVLVSVQSAIAAKQMPEADMPSHSAAISSCQRGRLQIIDNQVVTDNGTPLRGERQKALLTQGSSWQQYAVDFGLNTIRLYRHKEPQNFPGGCGWNCSWIATLAEDIALIDDMVAQAKQNGFYIVIDYHPVGGLDKDHAIYWWSQIAPRYKNETHVAYELSNEPVAWHPSQYDTDDIQAQIEIYNEIRSHAPNTHIILWSFANATAGMLGKVSQAPTVDYSNASVGYHPYQFSQSAYNELQANYPVINTEIGGFSRADYINRTNQAESDGTSWLWLDGVRVSQRFGGEPLERTWPQDPVAVACSTGDDPTPTPTLPPPTNTPVPTTEPPTATPSPTTEPPTATPSPTAVPPTPTPTPEPSERLRIPGRIEAEAYAQGGQGVAYHDTTPGNFGGVLRNDDVDLAQIPSERGIGYVLGWIDQGEWIEFDVTVDQSDTYTLKAYLASAHSGSKRFHLELDGVDISGAVELTTHTDWYDFQEIVIPNVILSAGDYRLRLVIDSDTYFNIDYIDFIADSSAPTSITLHAANAPTLGNGGLVATAIFAASLLTAYLYLHQRRRNA